MGDGGAQNVALGPFFDSSGNLQSSPKLYHYLPGGGTSLNNIWSDEAKTTPLAQPFVGTPEGLLNFYADGIYRFYVRNNADDTTLLDMDNHKESKDPSGAFADAWGAAYPSATALNKGARFTKINAGTNKLEGFAVNRNGSAFLEWLTFNSAEEPVFPKLSTKAPVADITAFGADPGNSAADNQTAIQAAVDYAGANHGSVLTPWGSFVTDEIVNTYDDIEFVGLGFGSEWKMDPTAVAGDQLLSMANKRRVKITNMSFNGNNIANTTHLLEFTKSDSGTFMNIEITGCYFYNHQGDSAIKVNGSAPNIVTPVSIIGCYFWDLDNAIHMTFSRPKIRGNWFNTISKSVTAKPIYLEDCDYGSVIDNYANTWGANVAAIHLDGCTYMFVHHNTCAGTMAWGILTDNSSNWNILTNNDVSGSHTTAALANSGASSIIHSNLGTSVFQNGQITSSGATGLTDYNYKLYENETTTSAGTSNGQLNDSSVTFNDIIAIDDLTTTTYDVVHFTDLAKYKWVLFPVRSINAINQLQLGGSDQWDTPTTIPTAENYDIYPNLFDSGIWETTPFATLSLSRTVALTSISGTLSSVVSEKEFLKIVFKEGTAGASTATDINLTLEAYKDIVSGDSFQIIEAVDLSTYTDTEFAKMFLYADSGRNDITFRLYQASAGNSYVDIEVYRLKRNVDL